MKLISFKHLVIGACMFAAAGMALALKPTTKIADAGPEVDLEVLIPKAFGDWKIDTTIAPLIANPEQQAVIEKIYNQTLTRTYVNSRNERIMLSIAYGGDQSDSMAVHKPEVCYPAQGFQILKNDHRTLSPPGKATFRSSDWSPRRGSASSRLPTGRRLATLSRRQRYEVEAPANEIWPDRKDSRRPAVQDFQHPGR